VLVLFAAPSFGQGMLQERGVDGPARICARCRSACASASITSYASTVLEQVFENTTDQRLEGRYVLRTTSAAVEGFAYWNGEQKIVGEVFEKQAANALYDSVVGQKRDPGLLEQVGEGTFAFKVFPIEPHEKKRVEIRFGQRLARRGSSMQYRLTLSGGESDVGAEIGRCAPARAHRLAEPSIGEGK